MSATHSRSGSSAAKSPADQVWSSLLEGYAVSSSHPPAAQTASQLCLAHEPCDPLPAAVDADGSELGVNPWSSVGRPAVTVDCLYLLPKHSIKASSL